MRDQIVLFLIFGVVIAFVVVCFITERDDRNGKA